MRLGYSELIIKCWTRKGLKDHGLLTDSQVKNPGKNVEIKGVKMKPPHSIKCQLQAIKMVDNRCKNNLLSGKSCGYKIL